MSIAGMLLRAESRQTTADFYAKLGVTLREHSHGGPLHWECADFSLHPVLEIYERSELRTQDALMIEVPSLVQALEVIKEFTQVAEPVQENYGMKYLYTCDPDGRSIMLIEK